VESTFHRGESAARRNRGADYTAKNLNGADRLGLSGITEQLAKLLSAKPQFSEVLYDEGRNVTRQTAERYIGAWCSMKAWVARRAYRSATPSFSAPGSMFPKRQYLSS
jgi:hypothetical protein